ncbi:MAG TPA: aminotransferase class V-fold PLP-dependent enzyme [Devosiaceae bacterium]|jgi:selenocysteine lyase/cysteine desulfurase
MHQCDLIDLIATAVVGAGASIPGPFGARPLLYADYTASGRALDFVEARMAAIAAPFYANTHTETSYTGLQTTRLREASREAIRRAVGADARHAVIFSGSGATAAVNKLVGALDLKRHDGKAVVFIGPYEHHSNDLPWREAGVRVVRIPLDARGHICLETLAAELRRHADAPLRLGSFSAASNVTGIKTDMRALGALLHAHGAWFLADYAAGGPYLAIDMAESAPGRGDHCDAIFLSPHKFIGGPGASGVLVADKRLFAGAAPSITGGGTVAYVTAARHRYVADIERREEAGTPNVLGDIRAGLVLQLKADIGAEAIEAAEQRAVARAFAAWGANPDIEILGSAEAERLAIFSFNIRSGGTLLHPNFVVALLNDLFGIQARGGCSCAGPYGHDLLKIGDDTAARYDALIAGGLGIFRPGWVRLSFNFFFSDETIEALIAAVAFIARRGADFLPLYQVDAASGRWLCGGQSTPPRFAFADLCDWPASAPAEAPRCMDFSACLIEAERLADEAASLPCPAHMAALDDPARWFRLERAS